MYPPERRGAGLFHPEALAVGTLDHSGIGLMSADLDAGQSAIVLILAMVGAVVDSAFNALIRGAAAAAICAVLAHGKVLPAKRIDSEAPPQENFRTKEAALPCSSEKTPSAPQRPPIVRGAYETIRGEKWQKSKKQ
jgi:hypothetical protein